MRTYAPKPRSAAVSQSRESASTSRRLPSFHVGAVAGFGLRHVSPTAPLQQEPAVSSPSDPLEREADVVADQVLRGGAPSPMRPLGAGHALMRKCAQCDEDATKKTVMTKRAPGPGAPVSGAAHTALEAAGHGGAPLSEGSREFFESRFGRDFGAVRIHTDAQASEAARAVRARAYTVGGNIVFARGEFSPGTAEGRRLLAHELAHVVQRGSAPAQGAPVVMRQTDGEQSQQEQTVQPMAGDGPQCATRGDTTNKSEGIREGELYYCKCCSQHQFTRECETKADDAWEDCMRELEAQGMNRNKIQDHIVMADRCRNARWFTKSFCEWSETQSRGTGECSCTNKIV